MKFTCILKQWNSLYLYKKSTMKWVLVCLYIFRYKSPLANHQVTRSAKLSRNHSRWNYSILGHAFFNHGTQKVKWYDLMFDTSLIYKKREWPFRHTHTYAQGFDSKYGDVGFMLIVGMNRVKITNTLYGRHFVLYTIITPVQFPQFILMTTRKFPDNRN